MRTEVALRVAGNEASDLLPVRDRAVLAAHGARRAFWTVLDEGPAEECLALLAEGVDGGWSAHHQALEAGPDAGRTEDGEALAHRDGWVYVVGSHFGRKRGPLQPRRAFVARFRESAAAVGRPRLHVVRNGFRLHRRLNDALRAGPVPLAAPGASVRERYLAETMRRGEAGGKGWLRRLRPDDWPLNVEAAAWTARGTLLLGLRYPVAADGEPVLAELAGVERMFAPTPAWPQVVAVHRVDGVTPPGRWTGLRALAARPDGAFDAVIGSIDALDKDSTVLDSHPHGGEVHCRHVRFRPAEGGGGCAGEVVRELAPLHHVEGLADVDGRHYYVTDEEHRVALLVHQA